MFVQELNRESVAAQNMFYNADLGQVHEYKDLCVGISNINKRIITAD